MSKNSSPRHAHKIHTVDILDEMLTATSSQNRCDDPRCVSIGLVQVRCIQTDEMPPGQLLTIDIVHAAAALV